MALSILYEDEQVLVVDKPSGMLVHRGWGDDAVTLVDLVRDRTEHGAAHPVQRLDRGASGAIVFARDATSARLLAEAMERGELEKRYVAIVRGIFVAPAPDQVTTIDHAIPRKEGGPRVPATTSVWLLATAACEPRSASLVCARPHTGRLHQIRKHLKHAGHPLLGDASYGKGDLNRAFAERHGLSRLALHARWFRFRNPVTGALVAGEAPMPDDLIAPMRSMGLDDGGFAPLLLDPLA